MCLEKNDTVCIGLPVFNGEKTIEKTINSLITQNYKNFVIYVCDNSSTDKTRSIIEKFIEKYPTLIHYILNPKIGTAEENWNFILGKIVNEYNYIALFHADDIYDRTILTEQMTKLKQTKVGVVFTLANLIDENDRNINSKMKHRVQLPRNMRDKEVYTFEDIYNNILRHHNFIKTPTALFDSDSLRNCSIFFKKEYKSSADLDLWLRIAKRDKISIVQKSLINYRISVNQGTKILNKGRTMLADFFGVMELHRANCKVNPNTLVWHETYKSMDLILCAYHLMRENESDSALSNLKRALKIKYFYRSLRINAGFKHFAFGTLLYLVIKFKMQDFFNKNFVVFK